MRVWLCEKNVAWTDDYSNVIKFNTIANREDYFCSINDKKTFTQIFKGDSINPPIAIDCNVNFIDNINGYVTLNMYNYYNPTASESNGGKLLLDIMNRNYLIIDLGDKYNYYFIKDSVVKNRNVVEFTIKLDIFTTYLLDLDFKLPNKVMVERCHKDRFRRPQDNDLEYDKNIGLMEEKLPFTDAKITTKIDDIIYNYRSILENKPQSTLTYKDNNLWAYFFYSSKPKITDFVLDETKFNFDSCLFSCSNYEYNKDDYIAINQGFYVLSVPLFNCYYFNPEKTTLYDGNIGSNFILNRLSESVGLIKIIISDINPLGYNYNYPITFDYSLDNTLFYQKKDGRYNKMWYYNVANKCGIIGCTNLRFKAINSVPLENIYSNIILKENLTKNTIINEIYEPKMYCNNIREIVLNNINNNKYTYCPIMIDKNILVINRTTTQLDVTISQCYINIPHTLPTNIYENIEKNNGGAISNVSYELPTKSDAYTKFMAENKNYYWQGINKDISGMAQSTLKGATQGGVAGAGMSAVGGGISAISNAIDRSLTIDNLQNTPDSLKNKGFSFYGDYMSTRCKTRIQYLELPLYLRTFHLEYYYRLGYLIANIVESNKLFNRTIFNYVKLNDDIHDRIVSTLNLNKNIETIINNSFNNGITFWEYSYMDSPERKQEPFEYPLVENWEKSLEIIK